MSVFYISRMRHYFDAALVTMLFALFKDCNAPLSAEKGGSGCYPLDNHLLCQDCNAVRVQKMTAELDSKPPRPLTTEL